MNRYSNMIQRYKGEREESKRGWKKGEKDTEGGCRIGKRQI